MQKPVIAFRATPQRAGPALQMFSAYPPSALGLHFTLNLTAGAALIASHAYRVAYIVLAQTRYGLDQRALRVHVSPREIGRGFEHDLSK